MRDALLRELPPILRRAPRIQEVAALQAELTRLAPTLQLVAARGRMFPDALEQAVLGFARGEDDVSLATNIIETNLEIPLAIADPALGMTRLSEMFT